jgi:hypothetical protein
LVRGSSQPDPALPNFNLSQLAAQPTIVKRSKEDKVAALQDREIDRLSDLFAQGRLSNASEIARLLTIELGERHDPETETESLEPYLELLSRIASRR